MRAEATTKTTTVHESHIWHASASLQQRAEVQRISDVGASHCRTCGAVVSSLDPAKYVHERLLEQLIELVRTAHIVGAGKQ